jgi:hypothetical protein
MRLLRSQTLTLLAVSIAIDLTPLHLPAQRPRPAAATPIDSSAPSGVSGETIAGLRARSIGPAVTSGRVMSLAVHPSNPGIIYVGTASGGLWKSVSGGAQWTPLMDREGSYSVGWVTLDPNNPNIVWVGTGEKFFDCV